MTIPTFYNDTDPFATTWLLYLLGEGHLTDGRVDGRPIQEIKADEIRDYWCAHFFAGIGGWPYALRLAGWPDDRPVWTGSCPCQPFSAAGKRGGAGDERHLWPAFYRLIAELRPATIFGEQVASRLGRMWLAAVRSDLECLGYAVGAADLPAAGVGAPHIRQRLFWVAHAEGERRIGRSDDENGRRRQRASGRRDADSGMGNAISERLEGLAGHGGGGDEPGRNRSKPDGSTAQADAWDSPEWLTCADGKARPTQPGLHPLAHGVPGRVGRLRGYGNAIVPQAAAAFVTAAMEAIL